jgi:hypothetical protein
MKVVAENSSMGTTCAEIFNRVRSNVANLSVSARVVLGLDEKVIEFSAEPHHS